MSNFQTQLSADQLASRIGRATAEKPVVPPTVPAPNVRIPNPALFENITPVKTAWDLATELEPKAADLSDEVYRTAKAIPAAIVSDAEDLQKVIDEGADPATVKVTDKHERAARSADAIARARWNATAALLRKRWDAFEVALRDAAPQIADAAEARANELGDRMRALAAELEALDGQYLDSVDDLELAILFEDETRYVRKTGAPASTHEYPPITELWRPPNRGSIRFGRGMLSEIETDKLGQTIKAHVSRDVRPSAKPTYTQSSPFDAVAQQRRGERRIA